MKIKFGLLLLGFCLAGCSTSRDLTSKHYIPEWKNEFINVPAPTETSGGYWTVKAAQTTGNAVGRTLLVPFAVAGNTAMNAYYVPTWPARWLFRGDKRLLVWYPIFKVGDRVGSSYFTEKWNEDLV